MNSLWEKVIKRNNKKRGVNITTATIITLLLGGSVAIAKDVSNNFENKNLSTEQVNIVGGYKINVTNTGSILAKSTYKSSTGNGIGAYSQSNGFDIGKLENSGKIQGDSYIINIDGNNTGNGIGLYSSNYIKVETINNSGNIIGNGQNTITVNRSNVGNGIGIWTEKSNIYLGSLINTGNITGENGEVVGNNNNIGNGVGLYSKSEINVTNIENTGNISGKVEKMSGVTTTENSNLNAGNGIGIYGYKRVELGDINNSGVISGKAEVSAGYGLNGGNGIGIYSWSSGSNIGNVNNIGIIMGSNSAISVVTPGFINTTGNINNFGILLGKNPIDISGNEDIEVNNKGLMVEIDENGNVLNIETDEEKSQDIGYKNVDYIVMNGKISQDKKSTETIKASELNSHKSNLILNGIDKTLTVDKELSLDNSIINAYKTAIEIQGDNIFTGNNITVNGGGLDRQTAVIVGDELGNKISLKGNSIINGNIDLGEGKDLIVFGEDKTSTHSSNDSAINITGNVAGVETMDVNQNVIFGENSQVTGVNNINIGSNGSLKLTLKTDGDKSSHALSGNNINIFGNDSKTGDIVLITNGIGNGTTVDMSGIKLDNVSLALNSILYKSEVIGDGSSIKIDVNGSLEDMINSGEIPSQPDEGDNSNSENSEGNENNSSNIILDLANGIKYEDLNMLVTTIENSDLDELNKLLGTDKAKQKEYLVKYLAETYTTSPYSLSAELSKKSANMFENVVISKDLKPKLNRWSVYGGFTHIDGEAKDSYYGVDNQFYTTSAYGVDIDTKLTGMYVMGEYGLQDNLVAGLIFGGNQGEGKFSNGSKVEGENIYLGAYAKKYLGNLRLLGGLGYQYGDFEADRYSLGADKIRDYDSKYNDNTFDIYADIKYSHKLSEDLYLEPNIGVNHIFVSQDGTKESGNLGMKISSKDFNYTTLKTGVDIRKDINTSKAKHSISTGIFYEKLIDGANEEKLEAQFNNSTKSMNLLVAEKNSDRVGIRAKYEVDLQNGIGFDIKGSYTFARDTHQGDMKHKDDGEWRVGVGIGYKF